MALRRAQPDASLRHRVEEAGLGKIARDVSLLAQTEVGEAAEGTGGGSSATPHKRNPVNASVVLAAAVRAAATMLEGLVINPSPMRLRQIRP